MVIVDVVFIVTLISVERLVTSLVSLEKTQALSSIEFCSSKLARQFMFNFFRTYIIRSQYILFYGE